MKLNFGCGPKILPGYVNMDIIPLPGVEVVHDILDIPYPFDNESFDHILCSHVLEHVPHQIFPGKPKDALLTVMEELHRILKAGGTIEIRGPHPRLGIYYFNNPTHYRVITEWTFDGLVGDAHSSCVAFWSTHRFQSLKWKGDSLTPPTSLQGIVRRVPFLLRWVGRPSELVITLTK